MITVRAGPGSCKAEAPKGRFGVRRAVLARWLAEGERGPEAEGSLPLRCGCAESAFAAGERKGAGHAKREGRSQRPSPACVVYLWISFWKNSHASLSVNFSWTILQTACAISTGCSLWKMLRPMSTP